MQMLVVISYLSLALGLFINWGHYNVYALVCVLLSFIALLAAGWIRLRNMFRLGTSRSLHQVMIGGVLLFALLGFMNFPVMYPHHRWYLYLHTATLIIVIIVVIIAYMIPRAPSQMRQMGLFIAIGLGVTLRLLLPIASPEPLIDVHAVQQQAAEHLLHGRNPYTQPITGPLKGSLPAYVYLPANLYPELLSHIAFGDVRYLRILAELVTVFILWQLARRNGNQAELITLLFLYNPRGLFVLEQSWIDPFIVLSLSLFLWFHTCKQHRLASAVYGYMLSLKQYLVFFAVQWLLLERRPSRLITGVIIALLTALPFALWDLPALWHNGVLYNLQTNFQADSLTLAAWLHRTFGWQFATWSSLLAGTVATGATWYAFRKLPALERYLWSVTITTFAIFLFGKQAFCNYYYLVGVLLLFLMSLATRQTEVS